MAKSAEKLKAQKLRRQGKSLSEIAALLKVSKSSVANWCRDVELTPAQQERLRTMAIAAGHAGRLRGAERNRQLKLQKIEEANARGRHTLREITDQEFLIAGAALYWGEGSKSDHLSFINSDPDMVLFIKRWFKQCFGVSDKDLVPRVFIHESHRARNAQVVAFWCRYLQLPKSQFKPTTFIRSARTKRYENHDRYYGLLSLRIRKSSALKYRILGLIQGLKDSKLPNIGRGSSVG